MQTVICDRCGIDLFDGVDWSCILPEFIDEELDNSDFKIIDGKEYCPKCWTIDDYDNLVVRTDV